ncbi:hypothetical protein [Aestuariivirga sp.]|uniref:hypothetical protein n=1 Tax=Aestuariivirga sp. TaxID=2650926 RepID=UPI0039E51E24
MKNILVIDGADNCAYDIFAASEQLFSVIFPGEGQDIAFIDEVFDDAPSVDDMEKMMEDLWKRPVKKASVQGIHGTLFYQLEFKKPYYPNRRDSDLDGRGR